MSRTRSGQQQRVLQQLQKQFSRPSRALEWYHRVGELVEQSHPTGEGRAYGTGWVDDLAKELSCTPRLLRKARSFAGEYSPAEVQRMEGRLSWDKVMLLPSVPDKKQRRQLQRQAIRDEWTYPHLRLELQRLRGEVRTATAWGGQASR